MHGMTQRGQAAIIKVAKLAKSFGRVTLEAPLAESLGDFRYKVFVICAKVKRLLPTELLYQ